MRLSTCSTSCWLTWRSMVALWVFYSLITSWWSTPDSQCSSRTNWRGLPGELHLAGWILDYLTNRPQIVKAWDCVWPLNLQCGDSPGNYPSPLPLHTLHCRLHNGDDCVLKQFSIVSVLVSFLTDDDTEYRGLTQDLYPGLVSPELPSHQCSKNQGDGIGLLSLPLEHPGNKDWMSWLLSTSNKYLGFHLNNKLEWSHKLKLTSVPVSPPAGCPVSSGELQWQTDPPSLCEGWILQLFPSCHCQALQPTLLSVWSICSNQVQSLHKFTQSLCLSNLCFLF